MKCSICDREIAETRPSGTCPECLRVVVVNSGDSDEPVEPEEGDWVTEDHIVFHEHGCRGRFIAGEDYRKSLRDHMDQEGFWPNVWFLSDHGNYHLMSLETEN